MNRLVHNSLLFRPAFLFAHVVKKRAMQLTIRTPYQTILKDFTGFSRIITKNQNSFLVLQNKSPGALHILPPGALKIKFTQDVPNTSGDYLHTGGWLIIGTDNTCQINLMDAFQVKDLKSTDKMFKGQVKEPSDVTGKYLGTMRKHTQRRWEKKLS